MASGPRCWWRGSAEQAPAVPALLVPGRKHLHGPVLGADCKGRKCSAKGPGHESVGEKVGQIVGPSKVRWNTELWPWQREFRDPAPSWAFGPAREGNRPSGAVVLLRWGRKLSSVRRQVCMDPRAVQLDPRTAAASWAVPSQVGITEAWELGGQERAVRLMESY